MNFMRSRHWATGVRERVSVCVCVCGKSIIEKTKNASVLRACTGASAWPKNHLIPSLTALNFHNCVLHVRIECHSHYPLNTKFAWTAWDARLRVCWDWDALAIVSRLVAFFSAASSSVDTVVAVSQPHLPPHQLCMLSATMAMVVFICASDFLRCFSYSYYVVDVVVVEGLWEVHLMPDEFQLLTTAEQTEF